MLRPKPEILRIHPYVAGESKIAGGNCVVKLSSNEGAFGPPPAAMAAHTEAAAELHRYPDGSAAALRAAIGKTFGLDPARIVCGAGSDDLLYQLTLSYAGRGDDIVMSAHGFSIYEIAGQYAGATVRKARETNLTADVDALLAQVTGATRIVFLANPNNPTGSMLPAAKVARLRAGLPPDVLLVIDSAYAEYVDHPDYEPGIDLVDAGDNTVMTRTFSKIFGLGGLRIGWCYAPEAVVDVLNRVRSPFNVSVPAQAAAIAALSDPAWVTTSRAHNSHWRTWLTERLRGAGITVHPSVGNFILADFGTPPAAAAANNHLRAHGIIVRAVGGYGLPHCLRITIGTEDENRAVADALADFHAPADV
jgi:histidinol-phosphate aminotransferase